MARNTPGSSLRIGCGLLLAVPVFVVVAYLLSVVFDGQHFHSSGNPEESFDPIVGFERAVEIAGADVEFVKLTAKYVRPDGTVNLSGYDQAMVTYLFVGKPESMAKSRFVTVSAGKMGISGQRVYLPFITGSGIDLGLTRNEFVRKAKADEVRSDPPRCALSSMRQAAGDSGRLNQIVFGADGYRLTAGLSFAMRFGHDCELLSD